MADEDPTIVFLLPEARQTRGELVPRLRVLLAEERERWALGDVDAERRARRLAAALERAELADAAAAKLGTMSADDVRKAIASIEAARTERRAKRNVNP